MSAAIPPDRPSTPVTPRRARWVRALGLFGVLCAFYFFTYHGQIISTDEIMLFDSVRSYVHEGNFRLPLTGDVPNYSTPPGLQPVVDNPVSPLQVYAAAPLLWLAERLPGVGIVHAVWLFNVVVTALTGVLVYLFGVAHGFRDRTALAVALAFGLATYAWAYSQMFFRDPLLMLLGLFSVYAADRARAAFERRRPQPITAVAWLAVALVSLVGAWLTKDAGNLFILGMALALVPRRGLSHTRRWLRAHPLAALAALALIVAAAALGWTLLWPRVAARLEGGEIIASALAHAPEALAAYLISPGFSMWAFSPVLLLGLAGAVRLLRARQVRLALLPALMLLGFAGGHATTHATYWYGGLGWGPRFLLPSTPFLALWLLPVFDGALSGRMSRPGRALVVTVAAISVAAQALGVMWPIRVFPDYLHSEGERLDAEIVPWREGVWDGRYLPHLVVLGRLAATPGLPLAPAWVHLAAGRAAPLLCLAAGAVAAWAMFRPAASRRRRLAQAAVCGAALAVMFGLGLRLYYRDFRYGSDDESLWKVMTALREQSRPGDTVILSNATYRLFFLNYDKRGMPVYVLPLSEGEILTPGETPNFVSDSMEERATPAFQVMLSRIALQSSRWWVLTEYSPFSTERYRVTENYLARHYFPGETVVDEPRARLILYAPVGAPEERVPPWPERPSGADFGAATLVGFDLPHGDVIRPGQMLPVSLLWRHDGWPEDVEPFDYSVNVSLIDGTGAAVAQRAEAPLGSFGKMASWQPGGYYRDNHALQLPDNLPPGEYDLWVLVFDWRDGAPLPVRNARAGEPETYALIATLRVE